MRPFGQPAVRLITHLSAHWFFPSRSPRGHSNLAHTFRPRLVLMLFRWFLPQREPKPGSLETCLDRALDRSARSFLFLSFDLHFRCGHFCPCSLKTRRSSHEAVSVSLFLLSSVKVRSLSCSTTDFQFTFIRRFSKIVFLSLFFLSSSPCEHGFYAPNFSDLPGRSLSGHSLQSHAS